MKKYSGKVAYRGIAVGEVSEFINDDVSVTKLTNVDVEDEIKRFYTSRQKAIEQLKIMHQKAIKDIGEFDADIFEVHQIMLMDESYTNTVLDIIVKENVNAEYAVMCTSKILCKLFSNTNDEYLRERALDIVDVSERLIAILKDSQREIDFNGKSIIVCNDLSPSNLLQLDKNYIKGIIIRGGSVHSHTAILARAFSIPTLVSVDVDNYIEGKNAVINGYTGELIVEPTNSQIKSALTLIKKEETEFKQLKNYTYLPCKTKDGVNFKLFSNIGDILSIGKAMDSNSDGIGLFRTEFLCMEDNDLASEQEQYEVYKTAADLVGDKPLVIRTFDFGADKQIGIFENDDKNINAALGLRALRIFLQNDEYEKLLIEQLSAILRAAFNKNIYILLPMVTSLWEIERVKKLLSEIKKSLISQNKHYGSVKLGIMIETPAAAVLADEFAKHVDFFSIGTNDLTQYTLAADRLNSKVEKYYDTKHPAVLKMIEIAAKAAKENNVKISICGDLAQDASLIPFFIKNEIFALSVSSESYLKTKKAICEYSEKNNKYNA